MSKQRKRRPLLIVLGVVAVLVIAGGAAFYFLVINDDPPAELSVDAASNVGSEEGAEASSTTAAPADPATREGVDGAWSIDTAGDNAVGFRIDEKFAGGAASHTAVGRTSEVNGNLAIDGTSVTEAVFTADLTAIEFSDEPPGGLDVAKRASSMGNLGLETNKFPEATFKLTTLIDLGEVPTADTLISADAAGELTVHGVTKPVTFGVEAKLVNGQIVIATADPVTVSLADYGMTPPAVGPIAEVSDTGEFEFKLTMAQN